MREEAYRLMFNYLLDKTGGLMTLTPEQLEKVIGTTVAQQSVLRRENNFDIPHKKIGRLVVYSIDSVIKYLLDGETVVEVKKKSNVVYEKSNTEDLNHIFKLRNFANNAMEEAKQLTLMADLLIQIADTTEMFYQVKDSVKSQCSEKAAPIKKV